MYIGIEAQRIFRPKKHGMEVVALELIKQLQQLDHDNQYTIFTKEDKDHDGIRETSNFRILSIPSLTYADWEQLKLPSIVKKEKLDFLHCTCNTAPLKVNVPLIVTIHDVIYLEKLDFKGTSYQNFGNLYRRMVVPSAIRNSRLVITVSNFEKDIILRKLHLPEEKVKVIYNAVSSRFNQEYSREEIAAFRQQYGLPQQFILFLGNTAPKKNTCNVIKGYVKYCLQTRDAIPLVILDYDKAAVAKVLTEMRKPELIRQFIFPGYIPNAAMPLIYNAATLFLYPSLRESFGLPILEAMACGVPVITSDASSMPEVAGDGALLVNPLDYDSIGQGISTLLSDEAQWQRQREKGLYRASEFTWEKSARALLSVYNSMR
jgi:glycosyltransferase involved in cell wall biosynthesis